jgi:hypothetical protein
MMVGTAATLAMTGSILATVDDGFAIGDAVPFITVYDDFTAETNEHLEPTLQNTAGMMVVTGPIYTYIDVASGKTHPWLTNTFGTGLGRGVKDAPFNTRLNVNIGHYF